MYIVTINGTDASSHTKEADAILQKQRFIAAGNINVAVVSKNTFNPPQQERS
jgi:hypothetical protein